VPCYHITGSIQWQRFLRSTINDNVTCQLKKADAVEETLTVLLETEIELVFRAGMAKYPYSALLI
jgi:hypothetical protein